jgi:hypothetical protein
MPKYEECVKLVNPQGLPIHMLSYTEKLFLEFCEYFDGYPEKLRRLLGHGKRKEEHKGRTQRRE